MRCVFAETYIGDKHKVVVALAQRAERTRNGTEGIGRRIATSVFVSRESEEEETTDTRCAGAVGDLSDTGHGPAHVRGKGRDRFRIANPRVDEDRQNETGRGETRFLEEAPESSATTKSAPAAECSHRRLNGERHL
jgi:Lon protease-like protein